MRRCRGASDWAGFLHLSESSGIGRKQPREPGQRILAKKLRTGSWGKQESVGSWTNVMWPLWVSWGNYFFGQSAP